MSFKTTLVSEKKENVIERKEKSSKEKIFGKFLSENTGKTYR